MKCFIVLLALSALLATVVDAAPRHHHKYGQLLQSPVAVMQKRTWTKSKSKWTAMRRSSEEGLIEDHPIINAADVEQPEDIVAQQQAAEADEIEQPLDTEAEPVGVAGESAGEVPAGDDDAQIVPHFPPHTFFPMNFGNTHGGSLAVANSFSTSKGGAFSHAVAHGAKRA